MAYSITKRTLVRYQDGHEIVEITAVLDSVSDLAALGTDYAPGSIAMVADKGVPSYILNVSGQWKEI